MDVSATITGFHEHDNAVFYDLTVTSRNLGAQWRISHRYSHFATLRDSLSSKFPTVPPLPPKTLLRTTDENYLRYRQEQLNLFLESLSKREDLIVSEEVRTFLEVEKNLPEAQVQSPALAFEEHIAKPIRDAHLTPSLFVFTQYEHNLMFRADAYVSRMRIPFLTNEREYVSYTEIHSRTDTGITLKYRATHDYISTAMAYNPELGLVLVGFDNGQVHGFLVNSTDPVLKLESHTQAVRGILFTPDSQQILTVSDDKRLFVFDLNSRVLLWSLLLADKPLQLQWYSSLFLIPFPRILTLYRPTGSGPVVEATMADQSEAGLVITCVTVSGDVGFAGTDSGAVIVLQLDRRSETGRLRWKGKVTAIVCSQRRKELMVGNDAGKVGTFNLVTGLLLNVISADFNTITYLGWDESRQLLFTSGEERKLRVYRMPATWQVLVAESLTDTVDETVRQNVVLEDNLAGWDR